MDIKCKLIEYEPCIKCGAIESSMVNIGAFMMCMQCWQEEFNTTEIATHKSDYENYIAWLNETALVR